MASTTGNKEVDGTRIDAKDDGPRSGPPRPMVAHLPATTTAAPAPPLFPDERAACAATGEIYRHYKGGIYRLLFRSVLHTETQEDGVVYEHLFPNPHRVFYRPSALFFGTTDGHMPQRRFVPVVGSSE